MATEILLNNGNFCNHRLLSLCKYICRGKSSQKEVVYLGMLAIDALDKESRQELADKVHQM